MVPVAETVRVNWRKMPAIAVRIAKVRAVGTVNVRKVKTAVSVRLIVDRALVGVAAPMTALVAVLIPLHPVFVSPFRSVVKVSGPRNVLTLLMIAVLAMGSVVGKIQVPAARTMKRKRVFARKTPIAVRWNGLTSAVNLPVNVLGVAETTSVARANPA